MRLEVEKETLCINKLVCQEKENIVVEGDMIVPDIKPDIIQTISTTGNVCIYKKETLDGKVRMDGAIDVYVIYLADEESDNVRGLNTCLDFTHIFDIQGCAQGMDMETKTVIKSIECKVLNGRKINIKVTLELEIKVYSNEEFSMIKTMDNIGEMKCLKNNMEMDSLIGSGQTRTSAKDTMVIENVDDLMEILKADIMIANCDTKISYNKVLTKADVQVKIMYLTEDSRIKTVESIIPVMGFIDIPDITEDSMCDVNCELKNTMIKANNAEEHSISVEIEIEIGAKVYQKKKIEVIQDLYHPCRKVDFEQKQVKTMINKQKTKTDLSINQKISISEIGEDQLYDVETKVTILQTKVMKDRILYEGEIQLNILFGSDQGERMRIKDYRLPWQQEVEISGIDPNTSVDTNAEIVRQDFILSSNGDIDVNMDIVFLTDTADTKTIHVIDNIEMSEQEENNPYSMTIYFVKPGDTLWSIAKRFKSTVEDIVRVNEMEDENKIYPRQQLFIPKYVNRTQEVSA